MMGRPRSEDARKVVHLAAGAGALLLRYLLWWEAMVLAGLALAFNLYALPRIAGGTLMRDREPLRQFSSGVVLYPLAIFVLILVIPSRLDIVAAAWGILAAGDGMASIIGRRLGGPRIPWNRQKSVAGSLALFLCGGAAGAFLCWWCRPAVIPPPYWWFSIGIPFVAALVAAAVETIPIRLNDNVSVPLSAAAVMWCASLVSEDLTAAAWTAVLSAIPLALAANAALAATGYAMRTVSVSGAVAGAALGVIVLLTVGWGGWALLLLTFGLAVVASRLGLRRKTLLGIAEAHEGRRGAGSALANTGVAAVAGLMALLTYAHEPALIAFVAALAASGSDTIASEIGKAFGHRTFLVTNLREVSAGTPGGLSVAGSAAGLLGACVLAGAGVAAGIIPLDALLAIVVAATAGSLVESVLGATLEPAGVLNNDVLNFLNTVTAAFVAVGMG
jgi:uncharacterized protein (TIGR00297 family)